MAIAAIVTAAADVNSAFSGLHNFRVPDLGFAA
jgi:hypothetical protein